VTYIFERQTTERIRVQASDEETARQLLDELSEVEWYFVDESEPELIKETRE
jgi:hypothetical protein